MKRRVSPRPGTIRAPCSRATCSSARTLVVPTAMTRRPSSSARLTALAAKSEISKRSLSILWSSMPSAQDFALQFPVAELDHFARAHFAAWADEGLPRVLALLAREEHFDLGAQVFSGSGIVLSDCLGGNAAPPAEQAGGKDPGVVKDQEVSRLEDLGDLTEQPVFEAGTRAVNHHHSRRVALG